MLQLLAVQLRPRHECIAPELQPTTELFGVDGKRGNLRALYQTWTRSVEVRAPIRDRDAARFHRRTLRKAWPVHQLCHFPERLLDPKAARRDEHNFRSRARNPFPFGRAARFGVVPQDWIAARDSNELRCPMARHHRRVEPL